MSNTNGLTSLAPVYLTGDPTSNIWEVKGGAGPTPSGDLVSPVIIKSMDGTKTAEITVGNAPGDMNIIATDGNLFLSSDGAVNIIAGSNIALTPQNGGNVTINSDTFNHLVNMNVSDTLGDFTVSLPVGDIILAPNSGIVTISPATGTFLAGTNLAVDSAGNFSIRGNDDISITAVNGDVTITSSASGNISLVPGTTGSNFINVGMGTVRFPASSGGQYAEFEVDIAGNTNAGIQGNFKFLMAEGDALQIQKSAGAVGEVYDTVYNPLPAAFPTITALGSSGGGSSNIQFSQAVTVVTGGVYQLQLTGEGVTTVTDSYLSLSATDTGVGVIDYSGVTLLASSVAGSTIQLSSNYFTAPDTSFTVTVAAVVPPSTSVVWTGGWALQLVRVK